VDAGPKTCFRARPFPGVIPSHVRNFILFALCTLHWYKALAGDMFIDQNSLYCFRAKMFSSFEIRRESAEVMIVILHFNGKGMVKLSLCLTNYAPWRCMGECMYRPTFS
jgi:hypothetical protein